MKKAFVILLTGIMMTAAVSCGGSNSNNAASSAPAAEAPAAEAPAQEEPSEAEVVEEEETEPLVPEDPMTYEEYAAAEIDSEVVIKGAVQAKQAYYAHDDSGSANVYLQDETGGAYFLYELPCTEKEYELMEKGKFIKVKGYKAEWSGEIEVVDIEAWMFVDGDFIAEAENVTALLGTDELAGKMNK